MHSKIFCFIDTESTVINGSRVIYDFSYSFVEYNGNGKFSKSLRNREIENDGKILKPLYDKNFIIYEYADYVPGSKKTTYGYANYTYAKFDIVMNMFQLMCDYYKPDAIVGFNFNADIQAIRSTQSVLKTSTQVYMENEKLPVYALFKNNVSIGFDYADKTDLLIYFKNCCPNMLKQFERFAYEHKLFTQSNFVSYKLANFYKYATQNENIEQLHMGYYDNMYLIKCMEKAIEYDGVKFFPQFCMYSDTKKRKHMNDFQTTVKQNIVKKMKHEPLPDWFNDQLLNSKCYNDEDIEDIRKFHPNYGGSNKYNAPYFRGVKSRAGVWPPNNLIS